MKGQAMKNEDGPDFIGYFKHLATELLLDSDMVQLPYPEFKKERLKAILGETVHCLTLETDKIKDQIIARLHFELDRRIEDHLPCRLNRVDDEDIVESTRKRKISSIAPKDNGIADADIHPIKPVHNDNGAYQWTVNVDSQVVEVNSAELEAKLDKMEQDLEELLNIVVSKCRSMTSAEKEVLGRQIKGLPGKALDRVLEIIMHHKLPKSIPSEVVVNLEALDDITLWRLHYYVQTVLKENKLSNRPPTPFPLI
ncbi:hypothetical protein HPP92_003738 [Vanilla planifolia]|uniref:NET domain-containing protein n=1 Tax=Vanilla planifolia TaxID=51239 RepID=A0A835S7R0_VANPL|nr:hypothetical protein HPP92_003738 [Vanilla planifolia]